MGLSRLHGIFATYKPRGITCAQLGNRIKEKLLQDCPEEKREAYRDILRLGHGGTLDHDAEGVLALGIGLGCKQLKLFLHGHKEYRCHAVLGVETDTYNCQGTVTKTMACDHVTLEGLQTHLRSFIGSSLQTPPVYSAVKYQGRRLSDLVRAGLPLPQIKPRLVQLHAAKCTNFTLPSYTLELECGAGFYVRSLIHDLGQALGTCSHLVDLERTRHGTLTLQDTVDLSDLTVDRVQQAIEHSRVKIEALAQYTQNCDKGLKQRNMDDNDDRTVIMTDIKPP